MGIGMGMGMGMARQMSEALGAGAGGSATPPPLPGSEPQAFFVAVDGRQQGPFVLSALQERAAAGTLTRDTLVWRQGMANWTPAGDVGDLASVFANVPPPLPPGA